MSQSVPAHQNFDCQSCGACCAYSADWPRFSLETEEELERGLLEAGAALGMSATHRFIYITTPLAIRIALPAYGNEVISLMKSTALASTITLVDMTGIGRTIVAETFAPYQVFLSLAIVYVAITWIIQRSVKRLEVYLGRSTAR